MTAPELQTPCKEGSATSAPSAATVGFAWAEVKARGVLEALRIARCIDQLTTAKGERAAAAAALVDSTIDPRVAITSILPPGSPSSACVQKGVSMDLEPIPSTTTSSPINSALIEGTEDTGSERGIDASFRVGESVHARWLGGGIFYSAIVTARVLIDDRAIGVAAPIAGEALSSVSSSDSKGKPSAPSYRYSLQYEDGETETNVDETFLRRPLPRSAIEMPRPWCVPLLRAKLLAKRFQTNQDKWNDGSDDILKAVRCMLASYQEAVLIIGEELRSSSLSASSSSTSSSSSSPSPSVVSLSQGSVTQGTPECEEVELVCQLHRARLKVLVHWLRIGEPPPASVLDVLDDFSFTSRTSHDKDNICIGRDSTVESQTSNLNSLSTRCEELLDDVESIAILLGPFSVLSEPLLAWPGSRTERGRVRVTTASIVRPAFASLPRLLPIRQSHPKVDARSRRLSKVANMVALHQVSSADDQECTGGDSRVASSTTRTPHSLRIQTILFSLEGHHTSIQ